MLFPLQIVSLCINISILLLHINLHVKFRFHHEVQCRYVEYLYYLANVKSSIKMTSYQLKVAFNNILFSSTHVATENFLFCCEFLTKHFFLVTMEDLLFVFVVEIYFVYL